MRRFYLDRLKDLTGVSGPGVVAEGVEFADKTVVVRWYGKYASTVLWADIDSALIVHGHGGLTVIRWVDHDAPARAA